MQRVRPLSENFKETFFIVIREKLSRASDKLLPVTNDLFVADNVIDNHKKYYKVLFTA